MKISTLLHELRELSHLPRAMKIVLAPQEVRLLWPVLPGRWRLVEVRPDWLVQCTVYSVQCMDSSPVMSLFQLVPTRGAELHWITASHDLLLAY